MVKVEGTMASNAHGMTETIGDKTEGAIQTEILETEITTIGHVLSATIPILLDEQFATVAKHPAQKVAEARVDKDFNQGTDETIGINTTDVEAETSEEAVEPTTTTIGPARTATTPTSHSETSATGATPHALEAVVDEAKVAETSEEAVEPTTTTIGPARTATTPTSHSETSATGATPHALEAAVDEAKVADSETVPTIAVDAPTTVVDAPTTVEDKAGINVHRAETTVVGAPTTVEGKDGINVQPTVVAVQMTVATVVAVQTTVATVMAVQTTVATVMAVQMTVVGKVGTNVHPTEATVEATMHLPTAEGFNEVVDHLNVNHPISDGHEESDRDTPTTNPHEISAHRGSLRGKTTIEGR
jgi:hypothetical protein